MYREDFAARLTDLRNARGVSAREMSLSIGQNPGYIHNIECGRALPSMECFFFICEYLRITPADFFDLGNAAPSETTELTQAARGLSAEQLHHLTELMKDLKRGH